MDKLLIITNQEANVLIDDSLGTRKAQQLCSKQKIV